MRLDQGRGRVSLSPGANVRDGRRLPQGCRTRSARAALRTRGNICSRRARARRARLVFRPRANRWNVRRAMAECAAPENGAVSAQASDASSTYGKLAQRRGAKSRCDKEPAIKSPERVQADRAAVAASRHAGKGRRQAQIRHRYAVRRWSMRRSYCPMPGGTGEALVTKPLQGKRGIVGVVKLPGRGRRRRPTILGGRCEGATALKIDLGLRPRRTNGATAAPSEGSWRTSARAWRAQGHARSALGAPDGVKQGEISKRSTTRPISRTRR